MSCWAHQGVLPLDRNPFQAGAEALAEIQSVEAVQELVSLSQTQDSPPSLMIAHQALPLARYR